MSEQELLRTALVLPPRARRVLCVWAAVPGLVCAPFAFWQSVWAGAVFCAVWAALVALVRARCCSFVAALTADSVTVQAGVAVPVLHRIPRRAVTGVQLLRTPLLWAAGCTVLLVRSPGLQLVLPGIPAAQATALAALHLLRKTLLVYLLPLVQVLFDRNWDALRAALRQELVLLVFISAVCWAVYYASRWQVDAEGTVHVSWRLGVRLDRALRAEGLAALVLEQPLLYRLTGACRVVLYPVGQTKTITLYLTRQQAAELADVLLPVTDPLWHAPKGGEKLAFTVLGANGLSTLFLWWLAIHQTQSYTPDAQTAALAQLGQLAAFAARWLPLGTAWLLVLAGTLFCISLVRSALQAVHYTVWRTDTQLGSRGGLVRRYEMRLRLSQLNYADLRRSPATWALHYCPVFVSAGACRPELPLFVWREGTPLLRELLPEMAQLPPDTRADTTDRSVVFFLPAGIPLALCLLLTAVSRTTLPALTLPLLIPTGVFAALLGAAAVGWHREGVWQQQGQLLLCRQHRFHLHQLCVFHPDTCFTALQSPWAVTVQRANLTLVFPGKEKVTVRSVPLAALDFLGI